MARRIWQHIICRVFFCEWNRTYYQQCGNSTFVMLEGNVMVLGFFSPSKHSAMSCTIIDEHHTSTLIWDCCCNLLRVSYMPFFWHHEGIQMTEVGKDANVNAMSLWYNDGVLTTIMQYGVGNMNNIKAWDPENMQP